MDATVRPTEPTSHESLSHEAALELMYRPLPALPLPDVRLMRLPVHADLPPPTADWKPASATLCIEKLPKAPKITSHEYIVRFSCQKNLLASKKAPGLDKHELDRASNKVLEMAGDSALRAAFALEISDQFPGLSAAAVKGIADPLMTNATLSYIAWAYAGFSTVVSTSIRPDPSSQRINHASPFALQGAIADLLEAYVGAVVASSPRGFARLRKWIRRMIDRGVFGELEVPAVEQIRYDYTKFTSAKSTRKREYSRPGGKDVNAKSSKQSSDGAKRKRVH